MNHHEKNCYFRVSSILGFYRVFHLRMCFFKGLKMPDNQHVDKKKRHWHIHKASPFDSQQLEWILNVEAGLHSLQQKIFQIQILYLLFCSIVLMKKIDSICHQITEISMQMTSKASKITFNVINSLASMTSVIPIVSKNQHFHLLQTLNDFTPIKIFCNLNDLSSLIGLRGRTDLHSHISSKILNLIILHQNDLFWFNYLE